MSAGIGVTQTPCVPDFESTLVIRFGSAVRPLALPREVICLREWWTRKGLNLRPSPCDGDALPLSYTSLIHSNQIVPTNPLLQKERLISRDIATLADLGSGVDQVVVVASMAGGNPVEVEPYRPRGGTRTLTCCCLQTLRTDFRFPSHVSLTHNHATEICMAIESLPGGKRASLCRWPDEGGALGEGSG